MEINEEEWEVMNDDGFVYKRLKRPCLDSTAVVAPTPPLPDPAAEAKAHRERKKALLLKLKAKYQQEIHHWEHLSNTLNALQDHVQNQPPPTILPDQTTFVVNENSSDSSCQELTDTLLAQVEAQEATICEVSRLCDATEALCDVEEQRLKQPFMDLQIWGASPRELMTSLSEE